MTEKRRIVRIFLASPGDLMKEREAAKEVVEEFNSQLADHFGCHIELMGWEDTLPSYGRPQGLINQDLERCEFFIGMMWMRWGTPLIPKVNIVPVLRKNLIFQLIEGERRKNQK